MFDRSSPLPTGGYLEQADGTAWMAFFSQQMLRISVELALHDPAYEEFVIKFFEHTCGSPARWTGSGTNQDEMWDEEDGFFYDVLRLPDGQAMRLKVRSMVGLLPLCRGRHLRGGPRWSGFRRSCGTRAVVPHPPPRAPANVHMPAERRACGRRMLSIVDEKKLRRILAQMLDENEFLGPHGIRALSRYHLEHPYVFRLGGQEFRVGYVPGESDSGMFGGNSNWRGPVWMPVNFLICAALLRLYAYYGDDFKVECPTGSGKQMTLFEVARELGERLISIFSRDSLGTAAGATAAPRSSRPTRTGATCILFYEYFHGDNGAGIGASHQTGWTGCIARVIQGNGLLTEELLYAPDLEQRVMSAVKQP